MFKSLAKFCRVERVSQDKDALNFFLMPPGFTCVVKTRSPTYQKDAVHLLNQMPSSKDLAEQIFSSMPLSAFNHLLFRAEPEEKEISNDKRGTYGLQNYGSFKYSGLASIMHMLRYLKVQGDMGHELFQNMRAGNWLLDYSLDRLEFMPDLLPALAFGR